MRRSAPANRHSRGFGGISRPLHDPGFAVLNRPSMCPSKISPVAFPQQSLARFLPSLWFKLHTTEPAALARRPDTVGPLAVATPTTRRLCRRLYQPHHPTGLPRRAAAPWTHGAGAAPVDDASLAVYLGELFEAGRAPATAALAVAAIKFRAQTRRPARPRRGSDRPRVGRLPSHGRRPGPGPGRPAERGTGSPRFSPPPTSPHRRPGRRIPHHGRNAGADSTP